MFQTSILSNVFQFFFRYFLYLTGTKFILAPPVVSDDAEKICSRNEVLEQFHEYVDITLGSEFGKELKKQRSIQVEGAFGVIKEDMGFTRFRRRGMKGVTMEFLLVCLGYNLKKYHMYRLRQEKKNALKAC